MSTSITTASGDLVASGFRRGDFIVIHGSAQAAIASTASPDVFADAFVFHRITGIDPTTITVRAHSRYRWVEILRYFWDEWVWWEREDTRLRFAL